MSCANGQSGRSARPAVRVARDLGIHKEALRNRVRRAEADAGERDDRPTTAEAEELRQLRAENAELRRANEILQAASVFFAQEIDRPRTRPSR
ncbi:transposase [Embleya sp. NPDC001921]